MMSPKRSLCDRCRKPLAVCYCHLIKLCENRWPVEIIQHSREQDHAIGTSRIAELSLSKVNVSEVKDRTAFTVDPVQSARWENAVLIYPGADSEDITELADQAPRPLVFIDGTWRKSKAILLSSPFLQSLPRYSFSPKSEPRYQIRKAAQADYYSTLEAIVEVLNAVEAASADYAQLLQVMDWMIEQQLGFIRGKEGGDI